MHTKSLSLSIAAICGVSLAGTALAGAEETIEQRLQRMEAQMQTMQLQLNKQADTIQRQSATIAAQEAELEGTPKRLKKLEDAEGDGNWFENTEVGAVIEVEAGHHSPYEGDSENDIVLATFELGIESQITDWVSAGASLLYEEDDTPLEVDVAYIHIGNEEKSPFYLTVGQLYAPFGAFETSMVSDPLTLEIGEARETLGRLGFAANGFNGSVYVFNGDIKKDGDNVINSWGANAGYAMESENMKLSFGLDYLGNLGDSDALQALIDATGGSEVSSHVGGITANAMAEFGSFVLIGEYLAATEAFEANEVAWNGGGAEPSAWNIEAGYNFSIGGMESTLAIGYQGTEEALGLGLPERRVIAALSMGVYENTTLAFEYAHDTDYDNSDSSINADGAGITGTDKHADTLTMQLAVEF
ncbi:MAG TPA: LbtU family siderophore porin [Chromatiaceae bacterium]|nr:LbtU family siderophore porin [Chromatiaceae bacterium]